MQETIVKKSKHADKLARVQELVAQGMEAKQACEKVGLASHTWYTFKSKNNKTRKRRSRTLWAQEIALPEIKASSSANVFALMGSPDQITQVVLKLWSERS